MILRSFVLFLGMLRGFKELKGIVRDFKGV